MRDVVNVDRFAFLRNELVKANCLIDDISQDYFRMMEIANDRDDTQRLLCLATCDSWAAGKKAELVSDLLNRCVSFIDAVSGEDYNATKGFAQDVSERRAAWHARGGEATRVN